MEMRWNLLPDYQLFNRQFTDSKVFDSGLSNDQPPYGQGTNCNRAYRCGPQSQRRNRESNTSRRTFQFVKASNTNHCNAGFAGPQSVSLLSLS